MPTAFPFHFDSRGRTAETTGDRHVRELIEQLLFTAPGERVNRPAFGSGALQLVFAPNGDALAAATQLAVHGALQQYLGDLIKVETVEVRAVEAELHIQVSYTIRRTGEQQTARFSRGESPA